MRIRTGVKKDGEITAVHYQSWLDGGAYASYGIATTYYTGALLTVTYRIPAYKFDGVRVYTNKPPCGPKRGHGTTQPRYGFECQIDKIAEDLGLDPLEYRKSILQPANSRTVNELRITSMGLGECLDALQRATRFSERRGTLGRGKGLGLAGSAYISGAGLPIYWNEMPHSGAEIRIDRGGGGARRVEARDPCVRRKLQASERDRRLIQGSGRRANPRVFVPGGGRGGDRRPRDRDGQRRQGHDRARLRSRAESRECRGSGRGVGLHGIRRDHR